MKALKTSLAKKVLADPRAKGQLREFIVSRRQGATVIELRDEEGRTVRYRPVVVPKAA
jgi:hypothetical protein